MFAVGRAGAGQRAVLTIDIGGSGRSQTASLLLFDEAGEPSQHRQGIHKQLEHIELEVQRTRQLGNLLVAKGLLGEMRFDAEFPDGQ